MTIKKSVWYLIILFITPIILGLLFYFLAPYFFSKNTINYGKLIQPIIVVNANDIITDRELENKWTLVYYTKNCKKQCKIILDSIKKLHTLTNDKIHRVQRLLLSDKKPIISKKLNFIIGTIDNTLGNTLEKFPKYSVFLMDPNKNIMMYYNGKTFDIKKTLKDLERLLKYSRIG